ncbi:nitrate/nitrite sensor protein NarQ [compost metagenome]
MDQREHHGLNIMNERARSLHGQLQIHSRTPQGTRIQVHFQPEFLGQHTEGLAT